MINCQTCNESNPDGSKYCMNCGSALNIESRPTYYPQSSQPSLEPTRSYVSNYSRDDDFRNYMNRPQYQPPLSAWAYICSFCVPLVGFGVYLSIRDNRPDESKIILVIAIFSLVVTIFSGFNG